MICAPCAAGGDISKKIRLRLTDATLGRAASVAQHGRCRGGTWCDCQHVVSHPDPRIPVPSITAPAGWCAPAEAAVS